MRVYTNLSVATWQKIGITVKTFCSKTKKYKSFGAPKRKQDVVGCWERLALPLQRISALGLAVWRGAASQ